jgi:ribosomal protein S18 acetylase RimI-like enzyme
MDAETLRRMQAVTGEMWGIEGPFAPQHVGDLAWMRFQHRGRPIVYAVADPSNPGAKALYESIGFVESSRLLRYVLDR